MPEELSIDDKIRKLRDIYTFDQDKKVMSDMEKTLRHSRVLVDTAQTDGVKMLLETTEKIIKDLTTLLAWDESMTDERRKLVFESRKVYIWFYSFFNEPANILKRIEKTVSEEFSFVKEQ